MPVYKIPDINNQEPIPEIIEQYPTHSESNMYIIRKSTPMRSNVSLIHTKNDVILDKGDTVYIKDSDFDNRVFIYHNDNSNRVKAIKVLAMFCGDMPANSDSCITGYISATSTYTNSTKQPIISTNHEQ